MSTVLNTATDPVISNALKAYQAVRDFSRELTEQLEPEDCAIQSMPDVSPIRWHLAHTTWFFETFILKQATPGYEPSNPAFEFLFNSYYNTVGEQFPRHRRGLLSRPTLGEVWQYRAEVDRRMMRLLTSADDAFNFSSYADIFQIGLQHEQQHQELILTDIKHVLYCNPLLPAYQNPNTESTVVENNLRTIPGPVRYLVYPGGIQWHGHGSENSDENDFCYDNETPRHEVLLQRFELADRLTTNGDYLEFIEEGGYHKPEHWLSAGWSTVCEHHWAAPLYWHRKHGQWREYTLAGDRELDLTQPVCHLSFYEADAFARWSDARLPTEFEWEFAARRAWSDPQSFGIFAEQRHGHPQALLPMGPDAVSENPRQLFGDCWEWTASPYIGYPGYRPVAGAIGEYNGKFMCNQFVLRGGSVATSLSHIRPTYRNFFPPDARWQFSGIRLAR